MKNMTVKQLRYVEAAGRLGSISAAATECHISQSSITSAIDTLETELGYGIFIRAPAKGLRVTHAGIDALKLIQRLLNTTIQFESEIKAIGGRVIGRLNIACLANTATMFLPDILKSFTSCYPEVEIHMIEGSVEEVVDLVNTGHADLAFTYQELRQPENGFTPLFDAPPYALINRDHALAKQKNVTLDQLSKLPMILLDAPKAACYCLNMFKSQGIRPNISQSTNSIEMVHTLVAADFGFSIANIRPPEGVENYSKLAQLPIADAFDPRVFGIIFHQQPQLTRLISSFLDHCSNVAYSKNFDKMILKQSDL